MESINQIALSGSNADSITERKRSRHEDEVDYISNLPREVVLHMFSFLPLRYWIIMCLVSKQWKYLWTELPILQLSEPAMLQKLTDKYEWCSLCTDFHSQYPLNEWHPHFIEAARKKFESFADRLLLFHSGCTINRFHLFLNHNSIKRYASRVDTWVHFAMTSNIERLELNFSGGRPGYTMLGLAEGRPNSPLPYRLKGRFFSPNILKTLTLNCCRFKADTFTVFKSLQSLSLIEVDILDSTIGDLLSKCHVLKDLSMKCCLLPNDFMICNKELKIKKLLFIDCTTCFLTAIPIDVIAPNLSILTIEGAYPTRSSIRKATDLLDVKIGIKCRVANPAQGNLLAALLIELSQCQYLELNSWCIQVLPTREKLPSQLPLVFHNVTQLKLKVGMIKQELSGISCLLNCCPKLETLYLERDMPPIIDRGNFQIIPNLNEFEVESYWESRSAQFYCIQNCLKNVYMYGFTGKIIEMNMVKFLLQNSRVLKKLNISIHNPRTLSGDQKLMYLGLMLHVSGQITSFRRASADVHIVMTY